MVDKAIHQKIAEHLCQSPGEQTNRMAVAIIANASVFHTRIEGKQNIPLVGSLKTSKGFLNTRVIKCWKWIIENVNYWPIFKIASDLLSDIPTAQANQILDLLYDKASELANMGATSLNDLSGRMFQKLITDRKFLATFYTLPVSATLLAELVVARLQTNWRNADEVKTLKVGDLACGTGTLIGALYHAILSRHRRAGHDDAEIHSSMIEKSLYAFDIMPAATHLAASTLSNAHPNITFGNTRIVTMPYGYDKKKSLHIGSLDLTVEQQAESLFSLGKGRKQIIGYVEKREDKFVGVSLSSLDIIIMNPPFTRPTNHERAEVPVPSFAGFNTSDDEQRAMSNKLKQIRNSLQQSAGHGNAGLASNFIDLAHAKLRLGGILALVLPATFTQGKSWTNARNLLTDHYRDITVVSITDTGKNSQAFSADTSIAEVLVIATKKIRSDEKSNFQFVNLHHRPTHHVEAVELAKFVSEIDRRKECVKPIAIGNKDNNGHFINTKQFYCGCAGVAEADLSMFMLSLLDGTFVTPQTKKKINLPVARLSTLGDRGLVDRDIDGKDLRGPFDRIALEPGRFPTYSVLWNRKAERERSFIVDPDCELLIRNGEQERATQIWTQKTSRLHLTRDFNSSSQSLTACLTPEKTLGGRAWPNFIMNNVEHEKLIVLWFNSTLGLMVYWWTGSRQQPGRTIMTITTIESLLSIDPQQLHRKKAKKAEDIFEQFREVEFLPANESYRDANRMALDEALLVELLGVSEDVVDEFDLIRRQWCAEPSVHGGKNTRP